MEHLVLGKYRADCVSRFQSCVAAHVQGGGVLNTGAAFFFFYQPGISLHWFLCWQRVWKSRTDLILSQHRGAFEIPEMKRWRVVSCGLPSTNQNGIGRWLPLIQAFKMDFTPTVSPLRKDPWNKDKRKEAKKCFNPAWKGWRPFTTMEIHDEQACTGPEATAFL